MSKHLTAFILLITLLSSCISNTDKNHQKVYIEDFNWSIKIPDNFSYVSPVEWKKMQSKGAEAIENTYGEQVINQSKQLFIVKNGNFNYKDASSQPFDPQIDGDFIETCLGVNEILYETFKTQMPDAKLDSSFSTQIISGLEFLKFYIKIDYPNGMTMHSFMYNRLFEDQELSVNIFYVDVNQGELMLNAWENSTFKKVEESITNTVAENDSTNDLQIVQRSFDNSIIPQHLIDYSISMDSSYRLPNPDDFDDYYFDGFSHGIELPYFCKGYFNNDSILDYCLIFIKDTTEQIIVSFHSNMDGFNSYILERNPLAQHQKKNRKVISYIIETEKEKVLEAIDTTYRIDFEGISIGNMLESLSYLAVWDSVSNRYKDLLFD